MAQDNPTRLRRGGPQDMLSERSPRPVHESPRPISGRPGSIPRYPGRILENLARGVA